MKEDALESLQKMNSHADNSKNFRKQIASSESEIERIELENEINKEFNNIWYLILFGEFEDATEQLKSYSQLSSSYLIYDSKAMINFYKLSGYLNLMSGNVDASLSFYNQIPRELLDGDNYHLYFYALAINAKGNKEKSKEIFQYLANYNFAGWENSVVRSLAQAQLEG
jgi:tetratricopeptide (TPR) repeat protein